MPTVRRATDDDREAIAAVQRAAILAHGPAAYSEPAVEAWASYPEPDVYPLHDPDRPFVVAEIEGECVSTGGAAGLGELVISRSELSKVYVHPDCARRGVGRALVEWAVEAARERGLEALTLEASLNAVEFYERLGFERTGSHVKDLETDDGPVEMRVVDMRRTLE